MPEIVGHNKPMSPTTDTRVSAVVLDYGNVLVAWEAMAAVAGRVSQADWDEFCQGADFDALNARSDLGEPFEDILADLAATHPRRPDSE